MGKKAIIIGAGPAGLTAAFELLQRTDITPIILEKSGEIGGISRTINFKGNRMDMGPHRFFSKSDRVMDWWLARMPLQNEGKGSSTINYQNKSREIKGSAVTDLKSDKVMLLIHRLTRIYFLRRFFSYPIQLSLDMLKTLGFLRTCRIICSYLWIKFFPIEQERNLEDFIINKFGRRLYFLFFKDYTEKVWGVPCHQISAEWGAQRIKGVSLSKAIGHALQNLRPGKNVNDGIGQKSTETSLIEQFLYPKYGPGSLWEEVARQVEEMGGEIYLNQDVKKIHQSDLEITAVTTETSSTGEIRTWEGGYFFSTMPVQELIAGMGNAVPIEVQEIAAGLQYRDFINVGILLTQLSAPGNRKGEYNRLHLKDNWIYIQERDVKVGRIMIYNNWGDGMIKDPNTVWIGMEYFCNKNDNLWRLDNEEIKGLAVLELEKMGLCQIKDVLDSTVQRMEKTYPAYFGTYTQFDKIRSFTDQFSNLFLVGRNGMHKYNNSDHSMLTAMVAVDNILVGVTSKANIWDINTEQEYHEEKSAPAQTETEILKKKWGFIDYLWNRKWNKVTLQFAILSFLVQFIIFKTKFPYANYMPDSYSYLQAASSNADVNMWPIAYSKFLRLISVFTHSDTVLVGTQYFFIQASGLLFLFTLFYWLKPGKVLKSFLIAFFIFEPVPLYVSNYISADSLFIGVSFLWMSQLIWIMYNPKRFMVVTQALLLLAAFTIRYNAIYYPIIAALVFLLARKTWPFKISGIVLGSALIIGSILYTSHKMEEATEKWQFSAFGGWQLANNALYMYEHISPQERGEIPARFAGLEQMVRQHMDTLQRVKLTHDDSLYSFYYLWDLKSPLILYMEQNWHKEINAPRFQKWAAEGPLYTAYAIYLIKKYPIQYAETFMLPNALKYAVPPAEFLSIYNMGEDTVRTLAKDWFNYKSQKVNDHTKTRTISAVIWFSILSALSNALLIIFLAGMVIFNGFKELRNGLTILVWLLISFWLINIGFSVFSAPIVSRYQVFPVLVVLSVSLIGLETIYKLAIKQEAIVSMTKSKI